MAIIIKTLKRKSAMFKWNISKKKQKKVNDELSYFQLTYSPSLIFGVTANTAKEAEEIVCEEVFHNQTIPGFPEIELLTEQQVKERFSEVSFEKIKQIGVWYRS